MIKLSLHLGPFVVQRGWAGCVNVPFLDTLLFPKKMRMMTLLKNHNKSKSRFYPISGYLHWRN